MSPSIDTLSPNSSSAAPSTAVSLASCVQPEVRSLAVSRVKTYADPLQDPLSSFPTAPITAVSPSIDTLQPNQSPAAPSSAVSLAICVQPEVRSPAVLRVNTYADPLLEGSFPTAPITAVSPSIDTVWPNQSFAAPSSASSLATCVQPEVRSPAVFRVKMYTDPVGDAVISGRPSSAPITTVSPSIDTL